MNNKNLILFALLLVVIIVLILPMLMKNRYYENGFKESISNICPSGVSEEACAACSDWTTRTINYKFDDNTQREITFLTANCNNPKRGFHTSYYCNNGKYDIEKSANGKTGKLKCTIPSTYDVSVRDKPNICLGYGDACNTCKNWNIETTFSGAVKYNAECIKNTGTYNKYSYMYAADCPALNVRNDNGTLECNYGSADKTCKNWSVQKNNDGTFTYKAKCKNIYDSYVNTEINSNSCPRNIFKNDNGVLKCE